MVAVLVVGGAGYVGAHACKALASNGYQPVVYDNLSTGHRSFVRWGELIEGDIRNAASVADAIERSGAEAVLHFAACACVRESMEDPAKYYQQNLAGTLSLLEGMRFSRCNKLVFSSTCAVYGNAVSGSISEATPPMPVSPYGRSKWMVEQVISDYAAAYGLEAIRLRYFNASGADEAAEIGEDHSPETHLIPSALATLRRPNSGFTVFGTDFDTPDGTAIRDYIHVADLADAHVTALEAVMGGHSGVYNLGTGCGHSVQEVLRTIAEVTGRDVPAAYAGRRMGEPAALVADAALAWKRLGFQPTRSVLPEIVRTAWAWHERLSARALAGALT